MGAKKIAGSVSNHLEKLNASGVSQGSFTLLIAILIFVVFVMLRVLLTRSQAVSDEEHGCVSGQKSIRAHTAPMLRVGRCIPMWGQCALQSAPVLVAPGVKYDSFGAGQAPGAPLRSSMASISTSADSLEETVYYVSGVPDGSEKNAADVYGECVSMAMDDHFSPSQLSSGFDMSLNDTPRGVAAQPVCETGSQRRSRPSLSQWWSGASGEEDVNNAGTEEFDIAGQDSPRAAPQRQVGACGDKLQQRKRRSLSHWWGTDEKAGNLSPSPVLEVASPVRCGVTSAQ